MTKIKCRHITCKNNDGDFNCNQGLIWLGNVKNGCGSFEEDYWKVSIWLNHVLYDIVQTSNQKVIE